MRHLGFGLLLLGMALMAHAAAPENSIYFRHPDLVTVQIAQFDIDGFVRAKPYRLSLSIVPTYAANNAPFGSISDSISGSHPVGEQPAAWATTDSWSRFVDKDNTLSSPLLRLESKGERLEIRPRRHSVSLQWTKTLY